MPIAASEPSVCDEILKMLKSKSPNTVAKVERALREVGQIAAEFLLEHACNTRYALCNRLQFLRLARDIGAGYNTDTAVWLQQLIDDKHQEIVVEAKGFLLEISPFGPAAIIALPYLTMKPNNMREIKKQIASRKKKWARYNLRLE